MFPDHIVLCIVCFLHNENITHLKLLQSTHNISYTTCKYVQYSTFLQCCSVLRRPSSNGIPYLLNLYSLQKQVMGKWLLRDSWVAKCGVEFLRNLTCISGDCSILPTTIYQSYVTQVNARRHRWRQLRHLFKKLRAVRLLRNGRGRSDRKSVSFTFELENHMRYRVVLSYPPWPQPEE